MTAGGGSAAGVSSSRRAAVLGSPIAHSLSPTLHRAAYGQLGLQWRYDAIEVGEGELAGFVRGCGPEWAGLSLTMPLKRAVLELLDERSDLVELLGVANTVVFGRGGEVAGHNTDVAGMVEALRGIGAGSRARGGRAVVLGGGATAASALAALAELGCASVQVLARRPAVAEGELGSIAERVGLVAEFEVWPGAGERLPGTDEAAIVVCTAPAAAGADLVGSVPDAPGALLDVSYAPWPPLLVRAWREAGGAAVAGDEMLLHQAVAQVRLMTGLDPDVAVMRASLAAELAARSR